MGPSSNPPIFGNLPSCPDDLPYNHPFFFSSTENGFNSTISPSISDKSPSSKAFQV